MGSTVIPIPDAAGAFSSVQEKRKQKSPICIFLSSLSEMRSNDELRACIHSIKAGIALVLVSLLYFLDPLYKEVKDDSAIWAVMTVVVTYEFYAGATLSKGINRGIGTILGGGLGCLAAVLGQRVGGVGNSIVVGFSVFIFGGAATYCRLIPRIKRRYDYGAMIFILTFNLVSVSGIREEDVIEIARERLLMIAMGFSICMSTNLFIFPIWASDELHASTVSKFNHLASFIEEYCVKEVFGSAGSKESQRNAIFRNCKSVLHSKSKDDSLVNFARWEPWHGKFGLSYPWKKYQEIGDVLMELASLSLSLKFSRCFSGEARRDSVEDTCEAVALSISWTLRELGESIRSMTRCHPESDIVPKLKSVKIELCHVMDVFKRGEGEIADDLALASLTQCLMQMVKIVEELAKQVDELGELAGFNHHQADV